MLSAYHMLIELKFTMGSGDQGAGEGGWGCGGKCQGCRLCLWRICKLIFPYKFNLFMRKIIGDRGCPFYGSVEITLYALWGFILSNFVWTHFSDIAILGKGCLSVLEWVELVLSEIERPCWQVWICYRIYYMLETSGC